MADIQISPLHTLYYQYYTEEDNVEFYIEINEEPDDPDRSEWKRVYHSRAYKRPGELHIHFPVGDIVSNIYKPGGSILDLYGGLPGTRYCYILKVALVLADDTILQEWYANPLDWREFKDVHYGMGGQYLINCNVIEPADHYYTESVLDLSGVTPKIKTQGHLVYPLCGERNLLIYRNIIGGIDVFNVEGTVKKTKKLTNHDYKGEFIASYRFTSIDHYNATKRYAVEHTNTYTMTTGWLTDEQAEILADNLFGSPDIVYMKQIGETREHVPVVITDTSVEYKTYQNQGKKLVNYTINLEETPTYIRK